MFYIPIEQFSLSRGRYDRREGAAMLGLFLLPTSKGLSFLCCTCLVERPEAVCMFHDVCSLIQRNSHLITIACIIHVHARKSLYFIKYVAFLLTTRKNNPKIVYQHLENNTWKVQALMNFLWV